MAKPNVSHLRVVPALNQVEPIDAINQATSVLEHLVDGMTGRDLDGVETNKAFGQYLLYSQIAKQLRLAVDQLLDKTESEVSHA